MFQNVSGSKAERYKITHNFFVLEDGRSNSLLQTYKQACSIKRNIGFEKCNTCVERTEVAIVVLIGFVVSIYSVLTYGRMEKPESGTGAGNGNATGTGTGTGTGTRTRT